MVLLLLLSISFSSPQVISRQKRSGISIGAQVSASANAYNNVQRPVPYSVAVAPMARSVVAPYSYPTARAAVVAPYPVARTVVVSVPQTVAVPVTRSYAAVPVSTAQTMAGVVGGGYYPYYYHPGYTSYGTARLLL